MNSSGEHYEALKGLPIEEIRSKLRDLLIEQHQGKWAFGGSEEDKDAMQKHDDFVRDRINLGIALTAIERGITTAAKPRAKAPGARAAKESLAAAITEDLLS